jgi:hypothetical protein
MEEVTVLLPAAKSLEKLSFLELAHETVDLASQRQTHSMKLYPIPQAMRVAGAWLVALGLLKASRSDTPQWC